MRVYAIGDLHLSGAVDKPMDIFGPAWERHAQRIERAWRSVVASGDIVLLPGDFSWAMHIEEAVPDMEFLGGLPGTKVMVKGNHDFWWSSVTKVRSILPSNTYALQNDSISIGQVHIAGTRGWLCPGGAQFRPEDEKIYRREVQRFALSLSRLPKEKTGVRIAMLHYPPFNESRAPSDFTELLAAHQIDILLYGHLHGKSCGNAFEGMRNGVEYHLVSADHIGFAPKRIVEV